MHEPSILELRGAIDILRRARKVLRMSGWEGAHYHQATPDAKEAWAILERGILECRQELYALNNPLLKQAAALGL